MKSARWLLVVLAAGIALAGGWAIAAGPRTAPPSGLREGTPNVHALVGAKIVVSPDVTIEKGTLVIRDGVITAIGDKVETPADARVWDVSGKTLYPGLIDAYGELSADASRSGVKEGAGAGYWNPNVVPHVHAGKLYTSDAAANKKLRSQGITARLIAPSAGIVKGTSILVSTGEGAGQQVILKDPVALHLKLTTSRGAGGYPNSPMGAYTLVRQAFYDAGWYGQAWEAYRAHPELERPERSDALAALGDYLGRLQPVIIDAADELYLLRADRIGDEFNLNVIVRGSGHEYRRLNDVKATGRAVILPLDFPKPPNVATPEAAMNVELERLMHWDLAAENPGRLAAAGVKIAFTTQGLRDTGAFLSAVRKAVKRGLDAKAALAALTTTPAELYGAKDRLGTLEAGKAANIVVADGDLFAEKTKVLETWTDGERHEIVTEPQADIRGTWTVEATKPDGSKETWAVEINGRPTKLSGKIVRGDKSAKLISPELNQLQFTASFKGEPLGYDGIVQSSATISAPEKSKPDEAFGWLGAIVWADGKRTEASGKRTAPPKAEAEDTKEEKKDADKEGDKDEAKQESEADADKDTDKADDAKKDAKGDDEKAKEPKDLGPAISPINFPLGAFGRAAQPEQPRFVLFKGATVWTSGPQGRLEKHDVLVESGKIKAVGENLAAPEGAVTIDAHGKHLSPGIIDCHSHIATDGGVNESAQTITAEVRIGDFVDPNDINIYRQLAGGVTASNILHGSANTIGGQNQVLKFRWGAAPEEMKFAAAPQGIKFALGENVKQSNWGARATSRYPQSRMGVEQLVRDAFEAARQYRRSWDEWNRTKVGLPPRVDLELEALAEVVEGKRFIHCHSYRGDEILALIRTCDAYGVKIATFQHVLEGYKVAEAIAKHGAGGSSFSDWWAYKFEVYDAIPYNGALLHNAGVVVSFNSDNAELARRLNLEAAKAIKYGNVSPEEALKFVTLNPAKQLKIDQYVGSIEAGKDADLVLWSGSPLSTFSRCEQTWVDGRRYFDLAEDKELRKQAADLRAKLVQRVLASGEPAASEGEGEGDHWPREDLFCGHHDHFDHEHGDHGHAHEQHEASGHEHE
jgi:N-acetylglucosamine-6-phosphate deacetylase